MLPIVLVAQLLWPIGLSSQAWSKLGLKEAPLLLESPAEDHCGGRAWVLLEDS